jgi:hypothetical protein
LNEDASLIAAPSVSVVHLPVCMVPVHDLSIWLGLGNTTTALVAALVSSHRATIERFLYDPDSAILVIQPTASVAK